MEINSANSTLNSLGIYNHIPRHGMLINTGEHCCHAMHPTELFGEFPHLRFCEVGTCTVIYIVQKGSNTRDDLPWFRQEVAEQDSNPSSHSEHISLPSPHTRLLWGPGKVVVGLVNPWCIWASSVGCTAVPSQHHLAPWANNLCGARVTDVAVLCSSILWFAVKPAQGLLLKTSGLSSDTASWWQGWVCQRELKNKSWQSHPWVHLDNGMACPPLRHEKTLSLGRVPKSILQKSMSTTFFPGFISWEGLPWQHVGWISQVLAGLVTVPTRVWKYENMSWSWLHNQEHKYLPEYCL